jgi:branched-chain amino acid transport system ATP-binding protein
MISALNVDKLRLDMGDYVLSVQGVSKRFGPRVALARVDFDLKRGSVTALIGPAGSGKSVALACIAGASKPSQGRVRYFGYEIRGRAQERVARMGIVRTAQRPRAFGRMSVLDTVTVGALVRRATVRRAREHAREMLQLVGLTDAAALRFEQLDEFGRRRLELARALATDPQVLLLDDLGADLEPAALGALGEMLTAVRARGTTMVLAARGLEHCPLYADSVVELQAGRTIGTASTAIDLVP